MEYKVTALGDVTIRAFVRFKKPEQVGDMIFMRPSEREEWIPLRAGEVREGLGLVLGVHPRCVPGAVPTHLNGISLVLTDESWSYHELPKEFFGLYRLEVQGSDQSGGGVG